MTFYLFDGKATLGPFQASELVSRPGFGPTTLVAPVGATSADAWKPASSFPELAALLAPPPPAPTAPPPPPAATPAPPRSEITLNLPPQRAVEPDPPAPVEVAAAPAQLEPAPQVAAVKPNELAAPALASPSQKLVMVVDDDENVRSLIEMTVTSQGFQVATAINGLDASAKLAIKPADLIVTDLMMPGQGGYEFLRSLQAAGGRWHTPVFVVTGSVLEASTIELIRQEANVVEFIPKPIRIPAFAAALHKHLKTTPP